MANLGKKIFDKIKDAVLTVLTLFVIMVLLLAIPPFHKAGSPKTCRLENLSHGTIIKADFRRTSKEISNAVNIPPQSEAVVTVPTPPPTSRYSGYERELYDISIEFSDGTRLTCRKALRDCDKISIYEQGDTVQADFHMVDKLESIFSSWKNRVENFITRYTNFD